LHQVLQTALSFAVYSVQGWVDKLVGIMNNFLDITNITMLEVSLR
jgi:hypothetical protein